MHEGIGAVARHPGQLCGLDCVVSGLLQIVLAEVQLRPALIGRSGVRVEADDFGQVRDRFVDITLLEIQLGPAMIDIQRLRFEEDDFREVSDYLIDVVFARIQIRAALVSLRGKRSAMDDFRGVRDGFVQIACGEVEIAPARKNGNVRRIDAAGLAEVGKEPPPVPRRVMGFGPGDVERRLLGAKPDGFRIVRDGLRPATLDRGSNSRLPLPLPRRLKLYRNGRPLRSPDRRIIVCNPRMVRCRGMS
jgi:hypothetical protein